MNFFWFKFFQFVKCELLNLSATAAFQMTSE